jgi:hypothetical protein
MQLDLFNEKVENKPSIDEAHKCCSVCKEVKPEKEFRTIFFKKGGLRSYGNQCKLCNKKMHRTLYKLKKLNPKPKDGKCEACGDIPDALHLDHNHATEKFRGWVCEGCNHSMGKSNDDPEKLIKQAEYLRERSSK